MAKLRRMSTRAFLMTSICCERQAIKELPALIPPILKTELPRNRGSRSFLFVGSRRGVKARVCFPPPAP